MSEHLLVCGADVCLHVALLPVCRPLAYDYGGVSIPSVHCYSVCCLLLTQLSNWMETDRWKKTCVCVSVFVCVNLFSCVLNIISTDTLPSQQESVIMKSSC